MRMLIVESDPALASFLKQILLTENYDVELCGTKSAAVQVSQHVTWDAIILDLALPAELVILKQIRVAKPDIVLVVLCSSNNLDDRIAALQAGADEYMTKPFSVIELSARLRGLLRRCSRNGAMLQVGDLKLDRVQHTVTRSGRPIALTPREFSLLEFLMCNAGCQLTRELILQHVWGVTENTKTNLIDVFISYLREKLGGSKLPPLIHTVRGVGYEIRCAPVTTSDNVPIAGPHLGAAS